METARLVMSAFWALCQIVVTVVFITINRRAADGRLQRNPLTGIRTGATMRSDQAWVAGHHAALRLTPLYLLLLAGTLTALLVAALNASMGIAMLVGVGGLLSVVPLAVYSAIIASRAAKSADGHANDRQRQ
ncbi:MAG: SdpI family protein [Mycobacterium sp.]